MRCVNLLEVGLDQTLQISLICYILILNKWSSASSFEDSIRKKSCPQTFGITSHENNACVLLQQDHDSKNSKTHWNTSTLCHVLNATKRVESSLYTQWCDCKGIEASFIPWILPIDEGSRTYAWDVFWWSIREHRVVRKKHIAKSYLRTGITSWYVHLFKPHSQQPSQENSSVSKGSSSSSWIRWVFSH